MEMLLFYYDEIRAYDVTSCRDIMPTMSDMRNGEFLSYIYLQGVSVVYDSYYTLYESSNCVKF